MTGIFLLFSIAAISALCARPAIAGEVSEDEFRALERWVAYLESLLEKAGIKVDETQPAETGHPVPAEIYHTPGQKREAGLGERIGKSLEFGGLLEVEAGVSRSSLFGGGSETVSDVALATAQLGWHAAIGERFAGNLVILWEEDGTEPMDVDEGTIVWNAKGFDVTAGRFYPPFGTFDTHFISDPLTLELGEVQESGIMVHAAPSDSFEASLAIANGGVERGGADSDRLNDFCLRFDVRPKLRGGKELALGVQYHSDLADTDSDLFGEEAEDAPAPFNIDNRVGGIGANAELTSGDWNFVVEYVGAAKPFRLIDTGTLEESDGGRPETWNFEAAFTARENFELAFKYEGDRDFNGFPKSRFGIDGSWGLAEGVSFSLEFLRAKYDERFSTVSSRNSLLSQIAVEF